MSGSNGESRRDGRSSQESEIQLSLDVQLVTPRLHRPVDFRDLHVAFQRHKPPVNKRVSLLNITAGFKASHQTVHILFLANPRCLRDYDLVVLHIE